MSDKSYDKLNALIVDDFESFRITLTKMLQDIGIRNVDSTGTSAEALRYCAAKAYDVILCDQNLGKGKTGQQILEFLRYKPNLNSDSLFVLVSAESNKSIIMAAYDYEPDAYLTKPITGQTLAQRLDRLFKQRMALAPVYKAIKDNDSAMAIQLCEKEINSGNRYLSLCQKLLGRVLLQTGEHHKAENLYRHILDNRQLDWAMLGMAQAKRMQGDSLSAQQWLEEIIQFNPLCLKAYDVLAEIMAERNDFQGQQKILQKAIDLSPLSLLRQQELASVSFKNNDLIGAANAYRKAVKLGENSCHDNVSVHENFARASIQLAKMDKNLAKPILRDALKVVADIPLHFGKTSEMKIDSYLLEAQLLYVSGEERRSMESLSNAQKMMNAEPSAITLEIKIELVKTLREQGNDTESERLIKELLEEYEGQEDQLEKIDCLLEEPCSAKNKAVVAKINKDGIAFYETKDFSRAVECFTSALQDFPQHIGLRLNLVQALISQIKKEPDNDHILTNIQQTMEYTRKIIPDRHAQFRRFRQMEDVVRSLAVVKPHNE